LVFILRPIFFLRPLVEIVRTVGSLFFLVWTQLEISLSQSIDEIHGGVTFGVSVFNTGLLTHLTQMSASGSRTEERIHA
jgi:hypothetical protein